MEHIAATTKACSVIPPFLTQTYLVFCRKIWTGFCYLYQPKTPTHTGCHGNTHAYRLAWCKI